MRVFAPDPGGGFGGKQNPKLEPLLAFLALRTRRTCRLVLSLEETFQSMRRAGCRITARTGFTADGELTFHRLEATSRSAPTPTWPRASWARAATSPAGPYRIPGVRIDARAVMTNTTPSTAFRGFGAPQVSWATESQLDAGARELGLDGLEIRRRNLVAKGEAFIRGESAATADGDWRQSLEKAAELIGWGVAAAAEPRPRHRGRHQARRHLGALAEPRPPAGRRQRDRLRGHLRHGPGRPHAVAADRRRRARDAAGPRLGRQRRHRHRALRPADLGEPVDGLHGLGRARGLPGRAPAGAGALRRVDGRGRRRARGATRRARHPGRRTAACPRRPAGARSLRGEFIGQGTRRLRGKSKHPLGGDAAFYEFNATAIEVEVDRETGELLLTRHVTVSDVGTELNPLQVVSQDEGAAIMGLGHSQMEQLLLDEHGRIRNLGALDYRIPTFKDVPVELISAAVENHDGPGPYGSKGISEGPCCAPPARSAPRSPTPPAS